MCIRSITAAVGARRAKATIKASGIVPQTEDNILEQPICKWPRGSKKWLICNVFKTLVENCKFTVTMTNFFSLLIYIIKSRSINRYFQSDHEFYCKTRAILNYNQNCSIWPFTYTLASFIPRGSSSRVLQERALKRSSNLLTLRWGLRYS